MTRAKPPERGHNSKGKAGPVNGGRLKSFVERIEKLEEERKAIGDDVRDVYAEAKGVGYDVAAMRRLVVWRRLDAAERAERDVLDDVYRHALEQAVELVRGGLSLRKAAEATGASKSSIQREIAVPAVSQESVPEHDPSPVETIEDAAPREGEGCLSGRGSRSDEHSTGAAHEQPKSDEAVEEQPAGEGSEAGGGAPEARAGGACGDSGQAARPLVPLEIDQSEVQESCGGVEGHAATGTCALDPGGAGEARSASAGIKPGPQDTPAEPRAEDDLTIPHFLRRVEEVARPSGLAVNCGSRSAE